MHQISTEKSSLKALYFVGCPFCIRIGLSEKFKNHFIIQKKSEENSNNNFKKILKFNI